MGLVCPHLILFSKGVSSHFGHYSVQFVLYTAGKKGAVVGPIAYNERRRLLCVDSRV